MRYDSTKARRLLGIGPPTGPSRRSRQFAPRPALAKDPSTPTTSTIDVREAGRRYIANRELIGLRPGTLSDYESQLRVHLEPFFGVRSIDEIDADLIDAFIAAKRAEGKAPKSVRNYIGLLHAIVAFALKRGWCETNPVTGVDQPRDQRDRDIRYLDADELRLLLNATPKTQLGNLERTLYLTAVATGLRRGELLALRWVDVDFDAGVVRVRRTFSRGHFMHRNRGGQRGRFH
jgi:integrase